MAAALTVRKCSANELAVGVAHAGKGPINEVAVGWKPYLRTRTPYLRTRTPCTFSGFPCGGEETSERGGGGGDAMNK